jgi:hypothetical protein
MIVEPPELHKRPVIIGFGPTGLYRSRRFDFDNLVAAISKVSYIEVMFNQLRIAERPSVAATTSRNPVTTQCIGWFMLNIFIFSSNCSSASNWLGMD